MNKIFMIIMMTIMMIGTASAGSIIFDQDSVIKELSEDIVGNTFVDSIAGNANSETIVAANATITGDYKLEFTNLNTNTYVVLENAFTNTTMNISWFFSTGGIESPVTTTQELTLNEPGTYYFLIDPTTTSQSGSLLLSFENSFVGLVYIQNEEKKGFNDLIAGFIGAFNEVVEINGQLWRLGYYVLIFVLVAGFALALFGLGFTMFNWMLRIRQSKGLVSQIKRPDEGRE